MKMKKVSASLGVLAALAGSTGISAQAATALLVQNSLLKPSKFSPAPTRSKPIQHSFVRVGKPEIRLSKAYAMDQGMDSSCTPSSDNNYCSRAESEKERENSTEVSPSNEIPEVSTEFRFPVLKCNQILKSLRDKQLNLDGKTWKSQIFYYNFEGAPQLDSNLVKTLTQCKFIKQALGKRIQYEAKPIMVLPSSFFHQKVPLNAGTLTFIRANPRFLEQGIFKNIPFDEPVFGLYQIFEIENDQRRIIADLVLFQDIEGGPELSRRNIRDLIDSPCEDRYIDEDEALYEGLDPVSIEFIKAHKAQQCRVYLDHLRLLESSSTH